MTDREQLIDKKLFSKIAGDIQRERQMCGLAGTMYEDYAYDIMERYLETTLFALIVELKSNE